MAFTPFIRCRLGGRELMPDFDVYISQNGATYRYLINNANFESYIKVVKLTRRPARSFPMRVRHSAL
jgi:hypothetical protein